MDDVEYRPQRGIGTLTLVRACIATAVTAMLVSFDFQSQAVMYCTALSAVAAIAWFAAYAAQRRFRTRLTAAGIESRYLRTRFIAWKEIADVQVVNRGTVPGAPALWNPAGSFAARTGRGGDRKVAAVRVRQANGRWRELALPVVRANASDPDFTTKAGVIQDRWRAATDRVLTG